MIRKILLAAVAVAALAGAARASTYDYSYTFVSGDVLAGSFDGIADGNLITDLSHISASVDGFAFNGSGSLLGGISIQQVIDGLLTLALHRLMGNRIIFCLLMLRTSSPISVSPICFLM